ncbi:hypothetical protein LIER_07278 [Lithospermum erythrorhizon]|uniref:BZIP domain-containing protein n=1 Tax=Lithospermum erythrorhizon TaxID=34254 RepID=A0AAV3P8K5_LITER
MGSSEMEKCSKEETEGKEPKTPIAQEPSLATTTSTVNPEWSGFQVLMQAFSPMPPHGYLASSPQAHPYMWGVQHLMPPYGTPQHPYMAMYPPGGIYAHPHMPPGSYPFSPFAMPSPNGIPEASINTTGNIEVDGKPSEAKEKLPIKRSKGSLGNLKTIELKNGEPGKSSGGSANGAYSKSAESGSEGSSDGSDANSQNESQVRSGSRKDSAENGNRAPTQTGGPNVPHSMVNQTMAIMPIPIAGGPPGPTTNLNIGMEYWGTGTPSAIPAICGKVSSAPVAGGMVSAGSRDNFQSQIWDERELKRQKRKQSNRESARRSRLRKQAECDELAQRGEILTAENTSLKAELNRLRSEYEQILAQNASLKERLGDVAGEETLKSTQNDHLGYDTRYSGREEEPAQSDQ